MTERPLPTMIGPTENALRSLLSRALAPTLIDGYEEWVAMNFAGGGQKVMAPAVAVAVMVDLSTATKAIEGLTAKGLLANLALTATGEAHLVAARHAVSAATATLVEGIDEAEQRIARTVLDTIRERAEAALIRT